MAIDLNKRYQTMIVLWSALLMSVVMYFVFLLVAAPELSNQPAGSSRSPLVVGLTALGTLFVILSVPVKRSLLKRSVDQQDISLVQKGMIVACAMCEVAALLGFVERFVMGYREYYLLFLVAAAGIASHFPRRSQLEAASYKSGNPWAVN